MDLMYTISLSHISSVILAQKQTLNYIDVEILVFFNILYQFIVKLRLSIENKDACIYVHVCRPCACIIIIITTLTIPTTLIKHNSVFYISV